MPIRRRLQLVCLVSLSCSFAPVPALCASSVVAPSRSGAVPGRSEVEATVRSMVEAVRAGDQAGYLEHVSKADAFFLQEQENWAEDLGRHQPVEFDVRLIWADEEGEAGDTARGSRVRADAPAEHAHEYADASADGLGCEWVMTWRMEDGRQREVSFPVRFVREGASWKFAGESWEVAVATPSADDGAAEDADAGVRASMRPGNYHNAVLHFGSPELAQSIVDALPGVRAHVDEGFEKPMDAPVQVKLYRSMAHLQASIFLSYEEGLGGWYEPGEAIKVLASGRRESGAQYRSVLAHEYAHLVTSALGDEPLEAPWWAHEGVAELASMAYSRRGHERYTQLVRGWARRGMLVEWEVMADFHETPVEVHPFVYAQGYMMVNFVSDTYGRSARNAWLTRLVSGDTLEQASETALHTSWADVDRAFRDSLMPSEDEGDDADG